MTKEETYNSAISRILNVYEIFKDYFGEERVDLQGLLSKEETLSRVSDDCSIEHIRANLTTQIIAIYIHFPEVRVTNEYDRYVDITHLWAKVVLMPDGRLANRFTLNRSEYTLDQIAADYAHSHLPGINYNNPREFRAPCTGSGPINRTITSLCTEYDEDLWLLFCVELDLYVKTESIAGTPYRYLENIHRGTRETTYIEDSCIKKKGFENHLRAGLIKDFYIYLINKKVLKFSYSSVGYDLGMSSLEFRILISNLFIEWINRPDNPYKAERSYYNLINSEILNKCVIKNNTVYRYGTSSVGRFSSEAVARQQFENKEVLTFKGQVIKTRILDSSATSTENFILLLNNNICSAIMSLIIRSINFNYGTNDNETSDSHSRITRYL